MRQIRLLIGQPIVDCDAADSNGVDGTARKAMSFQDGLPSILFADFKDNFVQVLDSTSLHGANEIFLYPKLVGGTL